MAHTQGVTIISFLLCKEGPKAMKISHSFPVQTEVSIWTQLKQ
jgi:hypothetical protein